MVQKLDNGDWTYGHNNYIKDNDEILQMVVTRLRSWKGDYFLNTDHGVDWDYLLGEKDIEVEIKQSIEDCILSTYGVVSVENIQIINVSRTANIVVELTTVYNNEIMEIMI